MQNRNPLELNGIIVRIAEEGSFNRAAKMLGIAPPSLTRRVASLERDIGVKLFDRSTRNVSLTAAGRLFVKESSLSLSHAERAWDLARFQAQVESGPYRIGYSPDIHAAILPLLFTMPPEPHPPGDEPSGLVIKTANTLELVKCVLRGKLHSALCAGPILDRDLWVQRVIQEGFTVCASRSHKLAQKVGVTAHDLDQETVFWMPKSAQPRLYSQVVRYVRSLGAHPIFREVKSATHALEFAAHNMGLALLPKSAASRFSNSTAVLKPLTDRYLGIETVLLMRNDQRYGRLKEIVDNLLLKLLAPRLETN